MSVKGKAEPIRAFRALRVIGGRGGAFGRLDWKLRSSAVIGSSGR